MHPQRAWRRTAGSWQNLISEPREVGGTVMDSTVRANMYMSNLCTQGLEIRGSALCKSCKDGEVKTGSWAQGVFWESWSFAI